jgi:Ca2+-transporting ATPase
VHALAVSSAREDGPTSGLTAAEAARRLHEVGPNELRREASTPAWRLLLAQFTSPVVGLLVIACGVSAALGEWIDAAAIGAIVVLNAIVGFVQEHRAERAILALRAMTAPRARVLRDGASVVVPATEVVPGDRLVLEAGDVVAADAEVHDAHALATGEAPLTGESAPVDKRPGALPPDTPLAERRDMVFMGTSVVRGSGSARVVATGMRTELGKIAHMLAGVTHEATPLQRQLARVSRTLMIACAAIVVAVAATGLVRGVATFEVFMSAVSLAVAAVPEGLPAVVTIALAVGVQRMAARKALVRRLPAVETLGCATVICTDKTGTLTTGVMVVRRLWGPDEARLLAAAAACCDAELGQGDRDGVGDPTELALLAAAAERGIRRADIERDNPRVDVEPFDPERKRMSIRRADGVLYVKGAVEVVLERCAGAPDDAQEAAARLSGAGLRVLAVAVGTGPEEQALELLGLVGIADPPRPEAIEAIARARAAGIRTVMITGDHPATAAAIARELGLLAAGEPPDGLVHARASPEDKLRIVRDWKARGAVVAMTGDGVNDAPALREAHIGVAMGKTGTEVTREAADIVLADDNFATIVAAIREGRGIFDNIRKTLVYLLTGNAAELALMLSAALLGLPLPLLPLHLLWINLVTDGLPALALVVDPVAPDVLDRPPRRPDEPMLGRPQWLTVVLTGALETAVVLATYVWALRSRDVVAARDLAFTTLVFCELLRAFAARSRDLSIVAVGLATNLRLLAVVLVSLALQLAIHYIPAARRVFQLSDLAPSDCALTLALGLVPMTAIELTKWVRRATRRR